MHNTIVVHILVTLVMCALVQNHRSTSSTVTTLKQSPATSPLPDNSTIDAVSSSSDQSGDASNDRLFAVLVLFCVLLIIAIGCVALLLFKVHRLSSESMAKRSAGSLKQMTYGPTDFMMGKKRTQSKLKVVISKSKLYGARPVPSLDVQKFSAKANLPVAAPLPTGESDTCKTVSFTPKNAAAKGKAFGKMALSPAISLLGKKLNNKKRSSCADAKCPQSASKRTTSSSPLTDGSISDVLSASKVKKLPCTKKLSSTSLARGKQSFLKRTTK